ncbi:MAG: histidine phosphatase family protein [Deltaproteobacteria bacterium]
MKGRQIIFARHGSTGERYLNRYIGSTEAPLAAEGEQQSRALAYRIAAKFLPAACWASPMQRARRTAIIVTDVLGIPTTYFEELREIDFGSWEGLSYTEIAAKNPNLLADWMANPEDFRFPDGEKIADFRVRVKSAARRLADGDDSILVIAHGGVIRAMLCYYLGLSMDNYLLFDVQPARFSVVTLFDQGGVLSGFNL